MSLYFFIKLSIAYCNNNYACIDGKIRCAEPYYSFISNYYTVEARKCFLINEGKR